ncbi:hypothetical protein [Blastococcus sp. TF02A-30]|uniref:hypothetical protein n=1 Tax=Blastococcus sp. TF02A-30 TaxID=2250580 RepID=UPI001F486351|nr:hypothetical protein [Blastococcus sp. TF02A-30]
MPDPHRLEAAPPAAPLVPGSPLRALLWTLLALSVAGNSLASFGVLPVALTVAFGAVTAVCVAALVVAHLRSR